jgi:hypothetical protein
MYQDASLFSSALLFGPFQEARMTPADIITATGSAVAAVFTALATLVWALRRLR